MPGAVILSAGFGETGPEGKHLEQEILKVRNKYGIRVIGPNCLGVILPHIGLNSTFLPTNPEPGKIALISQSGALGDAILDWGAAMGIGFSAFISLGSMIDVGFGDLIDFLNYDRRTRSIMLYMEYIDNARRFISASRGFAMTKPIVILKPGRWENSAQAIARHTGRRTGNDPVYDAAFKRVGAVRVREVADLFYMAQVLDSRYLPQGPKLAIITNTGGVGIIASDILAEFGGELARLSDKSIEQLNCFLPEQWSRNNPVDLVADADIERYVKTVSICLGDSQVDGVLVVYAPRADADAIDLAHAIIDVAKKTIKPVIAAWMGGERPAEARRILMQNDIPAYATPEEAVKTYLYMYSYRRNIDLLYEIPAEKAQTGFPLKNYLKTAVRNAASEQKGWLSMEFSMDLVANYGIPAIETTIVHDIDKLAVMPGLEPPVMLTVRQPRETTEKIPVLLTTKKDIESAYNDIRHSFHKKNDAAGIEILLQKPPPPGSCRVEMELRRDPEFRSIILLRPGLRGADDASIGMPPLNQVLARRLIEGAGIYPVLKKDKGHETLGRLENIVMNFSELIVDFPEIESLDMTLWIGQSLVQAGNIKILPTSVQNDASPYPHLVIAPYPTRYITNWELPDGTQALLRPIRPEDEPMTHEMLSSMSEETLRVRYFNVQSITRDLLIRSCNTDYDREIAIIAEIEQDGTKRIIGGNRLIHAPHTRKAQFAVLVHDDFQKIGLGAKLIDILIGIAREKGIDEIYGTVLTENEKMIKLCKKLGFKVRREPEGVSRVSLSLKA